MLLSKCAVCDSKNSKFINKQEASGLLNSLRTKQNSFNCCSFVLEVLTS